MSPGVICILLNGMDIFIRQSSNFQSLLVYSLAVPVQIVLVKITAKLLSKVDLDTTNIQEIDTG